MFNLLRHVLDAPVDQIEGNFVGREVQRHDQRCDDPQTLEVRRVNAVADFDFVVREALLPRPKSRLQHQLENFLVVIAFGVLMNDLLGVGDGLMRFRHGCKI